MPYAPIVLWIRGEFGGVKRSRVDTGNPRSIHCMAIRHHVAGWSISDMV